MILPRFDAVQVRAEGARVMVIRNGAVILDLPWDAAIELSRVLYQKGRDAEEVKNIERLILDHAILTRAGWKLGLSNTPAIKKEAYKEAQWNRDLRRFMPGAPGIASGEAVGTPSIISHPPKPRKEQ